MLQRKLGRNVALPKFSQRITFDSSVMIDAAPVHLEYLRGHGQVPIPRLEQVEFAPFSSAVAQDMAEWATVANVKGAVPDPQKSKTTRAIVSYDALIVGIARFNKVDVVVTRDADIRKLAALAKVNAQRDQVKNEHIRQRSDVAV
jgi:hypothetical protein